MYEVYFILFECSKYKIFYCNWRTNVFAVLFFIATFCLFVICYILMFVFRMAAPSAAIMPGTVQQEGGAEIDVKTFKEFLTQYNRLTQLCFTDCVREFTSREPSDKEMKCVSHCLEKFMKMTQRVQLRFQEYQMLQTENVPMK